MNGNRVLKAIERQKNSKKRINQLIEERKNIMNMTADFFAERLLKTNTKNLSIATGFSEREVYSIYR
jgi:shikimate kinase